MSEDEDKPPTLEGEVADDAGRHWSVKLWTTAHRLIRPSDLEYALPFVFTMLVSHLFFWASSHMADSHTVGWWDERHPPLRTLTTDACMPELSDAICKRYLDQGQLALSRAQHHFWIMRFYTIRNFAFLSTAFATGTAGASALVVITKSGWDSADSRLKGIFLGLACSTAFFGGFPSVTLLDQNMQDNLTAYSGYDDLVAEIRTYLATGQATNGNHSDPRGFAHYVDKKLMALNGVHISFDEKALGVGKDRLLDVVGEEAPPKHSDPLAGHESTRE